MKLLVCSDSHGNLEEMRRAIQLEKPHRVLHLGDVTRDAQRLLAEFPGLPFEQVRGNCDMGETDFPEEKELLLEGKRIWMLHGHTYRVKLGIGPLMAEARNRGADAVLFGHTHQPVCFLEGSLWALNPGTIRGIPRATYGLIELDHGTIACRTAELD